MHPSLNPRARVVHLAGRPAASRRPRLAVESNEAASVFLYESLDPDPAFGTSAQALADTIAATDARRVSLRVNSPGGDAFEGLRIVLLLRSLRRRQGREVVAYVDGLAAGAALHVATAADRIVMADGAFVVVSRAARFALGNSIDLRDAARELDHADEQIVADLVDKTGETHKTVGAWMARETWLSATEALAVGLVDEVVGDLDTRARAAARLAACGVALARGAAASAGECDARQRASELLSRLGVAS
jgi:ATP-dependent Clp protease protease subunit